MPSFKPKELWDAQPHRLAKITILRQYLVAWFAILGRSPWVNRLVYIDGFARPGDYKNSKESSPLTALEVARDAIGATPALQNLKFVFLFVEKKEWCVVRLRGATGAEGIEKQKDQNRAMLKWSMRHLAQDPQANVVILDNFNEVRPVGSPDQSVTFLFATRPPLVDVLSLVTGKARTHADGKAYDWIFLSDAILAGSSGLRFESTSILAHRHGKGYPRRHDASGCGAEVRGCRMAVTFRVGTT